MTDFLINLAGALVIIFAYGIIYFAGIQEGKRRAWRKLELYREEQLKQLEKRHE